MIRRKLSAFVMLLAASCGGSSSGTGTTPAAAYAGVYSATYSGTYVVTSPAGQPSGSNMEMATVTITELPSGQLQAAWQIPPNPPSGTIDFTVSGSTGTAKGASTGGMCFTGTLANGDTQTNCCTACSITFTDTSFVQPNAGTFTGTTATGTAFSGTYSGQWMGTKQ